MEATPMKLSDIIYNGTTILMVLDLIFGIYILIVEAPVVVLILLGVVLFVLINGTIITYIRDNR